MCCAALHAGPAWAVAVDVSAAPASRSRVCDTLAQAHARRAPAGARAGRPAPRAGGRGGPAPPAAPAAGGRGAAQAAVGPATAAVQAPPSSGGGGVDDVGAGLALLMRSYEDELKQPIRSALGGQLARSLLIQARPSPGGAGPLAAGLCTAHPQPWARTGM